MFMYAAVDSHKNGEEARAEKEREEGETDASSRHRLKISFQFGPRRRRLPAPPVIDKLGKNSRRSWVSLS